MLTTHLLRTHPEEIEADLFEHFHIDLLDLYRGEITLRRVWVLIKRLLKMPGRSALAAAFDERDTWSVDNYLIVELIDRLEIANWLNIEINSEDNPNPFPKRFPRPGMDDQTTNDVEEDTQWSSLEEISNLFSLST